MMLSVNGIDLHVEQQGAGSPALVLLHYWGGSSHTWRHVICRLTSDFRTVAIDQRGWGRSAAPEGGYALADMADDAQAVVEALDLERYILVGHSMGGKVAQLLASRRPRGLVGVVLIAPAPPLPLGLPLAVREGMVRAYDTRESIVATVDQVLAPDGLDPDDLDAVVADSLAGAAGAKEAWPLSTSQENIVAALERIEVPVFILSGEHDRVDPPEVLERELLPRLAQAQMHVLPQVGHLLPYEAPEEIADLMRAFALSLTGADPTRPLCYWCGMSLAAVPSARLGQKRLGSSPERATIEKTERDEDARYV
ncbi:alpha/beta fold hydrolase [Sphingomonas sp. BAUL-RG-20F-R05-02]|uniref:alpha/beta fold hydrolase n=1 Tax=Sphingomonas sp. BAUL-RG-20F-R05-02 TaxID=2914830 RepID=UPI001F5905F2|nr:alpha/beta hydrolase [Sphingomonas sp. BAUL-RG-20F-R05-02]